MPSESIGMDYVKRNMCNWMVDTSGRCSTVIKNYLLADGIPEDGATKIIQNAAKVLGYCPNPLSDEEKQLTGIVIGKVQSGKTSNFIALTALAFDNGYNHVVVLGGTKKPLVSQNSERIKEYFATASEVIVLNTTDHRTQLTAEKLEQFEEMGKKVIIVALKNSTQIGFVKSSVFRDEMSEKPTLIIDDEGDEASLNGLVKKGKKTATYKAIESLKSVLKRHCFVSVTATPQANLLISSLDILSPDFGVLVDPGKGYCGLDVFHTVDSKYVIEIPENETSLLDEGVPESFYNSLACFFVACAIQSYRGRRPGDKLSMLIHPSQKKIDHAEVERKTSTIVNEWRNLTKNKRDISYQVLRNRLLSAYEEYKKSQVVGLPSFDLLEDDAIKAIKYCGIFVVNSDNVPNGADDIYDFNIYVGGAMLGRGLTLKGLAITYIIRTAKGVSAADTVQQRARWFGYKTKYLDLCRIFAVKKIIKEFIDIREHEEDLWQTVRETSMEGTRFKDIPRIFTLSDDLRMTRTNVATTDKFSFKPWIVQLNVQMDNDCVQNNIDVLLEYRNRYASFLVEKKYGEGAPYVLLEQQKLTSVIPEIIERTMFPEESKINPEIIKKIAILLERKEIDPVIDIIWMRDGITSKHKVVDGKVDNYMVGRRPDDYNLPAKYEGDRYQFVKDDCMQLQIHTIEDIDSHLVSPAYAFYLPKMYLEKLTNLVIRS